MNAWIGRSWTAQRKRLILGESWWGPEESLHRYVRRWCEGRQPDAFLTCLFNACSGYQAQTATFQQRLGFWDQLAFMNLVYWTVGRTNLTKATTVYFKQAQLDLRDFLVSLQPNVVWILGFTQASYSGPVIAGLGIKHIVTRHPRAGVSSAQLLADYSKL